jgi:hypothetical protein
MLLRAFVALACLSALPAHAGQEPAPDPTGAIVVRLERAVSAGDSGAILALGSTPTDPGLRTFASAASPPPTRFIIKERDRAGLAASGERLLIEVFAQYGNEAVITTWRLDVTAEGLPPEERRITGMEQLSVVSGLHRLALNPAAQFDVRSLIVNSTDLSLELPKGHAFVAETPEGPTAVVLLGRGRMRFAPANPAERTQIQIFSGQEALATDFEAVFIRIRPADFDRIFGEGVLVPRAVDKGDLRRATALFDDYVGQTLQLDLTDLSRERWSLIPAAGDLIAEIRTRRMGSLTYARSSKDAEDVSLFERRRKRNISVYASREKLAARGRFYSEDDLVDYDVEHYDLEVAFAPERVWLDGYLRMRLRVRAHILSSLTLRLAEPLVVRHIVSPELGRLLHLRVVGQNNVIVNLPQTLRRDAVVSLYVTYGGRLEPQRVEQEALGVSQGQVGVEQAHIPIEPQYVYSNRSYWYPQAMVNDYATAQLRITVPPDYAVVASGMPAGPPAAAPGPVEAGERPRRLFVFDAAQPIRYLSFIASRFDHVVSRTIDTPPSGRNAGELSGGVGAGAPDGATILLDVHANARQAGRARALGERTEDIIRFYTSIVGGSPFPSFALAAAEDELPGGHSPPYFAVVNHPPPTTPLVWRSDPVAFDDYPHFFLAHEIAHQWWGHGVGWKNYHEQWLSEGFAQYFAAMYAGHDRDREVFLDVLRQMRKWSVDRSDQGPVYLGYRLGHIKGDARVFRALVYNKGAMVLHMLRGLLGDELFFAGLRQFYSEWKFRKAGTDDLQTVMEQVSGADLGPFFEAWIYGSEIPDLKFTSTVQGRELTLRFDHLGTVMPVPVTVTITYSDRRVEEMVVPVTERTVERSLTLQGPVRSIEADRDRTALADIRR